MSVVSQVHKHKEGGNLTLPPSFIVVQLSRGRLTDEAARESVLIVDFDVVPLDADIDSILAVVITDAVSVTAAADQFAARGRNADLDVHALRCTAVVFARTGILHGDDLRLSTARHFIKILVLHVRVQWHRVRCRIDKSIVLHDDPLLHMSIRNRREFLPGLNGACDQQAAQRQQIQKSLHSFPFVSVFQRSGFNNDQLAACFTVAD